MNRSVVDSVNFYVEFKSWYEQIIKDFGFDESRDERARDVLSEIINKKEENYELNDTLLAFKDLLDRKMNLFIFGCGPSLETTINEVYRLKRENIFKHAINIAADGAARVLVQNSIPIDIIFTDLDGITHDEFKKPKFIVVHAHGDNIDKLEQFQEDIKSFDHLIGTCQVKPVKNVLNPGGFTDGDRILFFLRSLLKPHHRLYLIGMDFGEVVGKYSKPGMEQSQKAGPVKKKKLETAVKLLEWLKKRIKNEMTFMNSPPASDEFTSISIKDFLDEFKKMGQES